MTGTERRQIILQMLKNTNTPLSGGALGKATGVSRQVIVQDMALLRTEGQPILATARGYLLEKTGQSSQAIRKLKVYHGEDRTEDELLTVVDLGGCVLDVMVNHRVYGQISAPLNIRNRRDVTKFMDNLRSGKSTPLMNITSGYHFHHIMADSQEILDEIEAALKEKNYLAPLLPYEEEGPGED